LRKKWTGRCATVPDFGRIEAHAFDAKGVDGRAKALASIGTAKRIQVAWGIPSHVCQSLGPFSLDSDRAKASE